MKRFFALILVFALCLQFAACSGSGQPSQTTEPALTDAPQTEPRISEIDLTAYRIIRPDNATPSYIAYFADFFAKLREKTEYNDYTFTTDFVREGTNFVETEYEILLGATNREESASVLEGKEKTDYVIAVVGTKIVINAGTRLSLQAALDAFIDICVTKSSTKVKEDVLAVSGSFAGDSYYPVLEGIRLTAMGDSYFGGSQLGKDGVWLKLLADEYDMKLNNYGIGGSTVSNFVGSDGKNRNPMCDRIASMKSGADVVIIEGGRNDYNIKVPLGDIDSRDKGTFAGALNFIIDTYKEKYPEAMLMGVTGWYVNESMQKYVHMMIAVCEKQGIVCFDASNQELTGVYMDKPEFRAEFCQTPTDVSHLNAEGMALVEPVFEKFIAEEYTKFLAQKEGNKQ